MTPNMIAMQAASQNVARMIALVAQYEAAKYVLANGDEVDIPAGKITTLKQRFATLRNETKDLLDSVTA